MFNFCEFSYCWCVDICIEFNWSGVVEFMFKKVDYIGIFLRFFWSCGDKVVGWRIFV